MNNQYRFDNASKINFGLKESVENWKKKLEEIKGFKKFI
jgi:hypothetical protein